MIKELINQLTSNIIQVILVGVFTYVGIAFKNLNKKYVNSETKSIIVRDCVKCVEQIYTDLHGDDKKAECENRIVQLLYEKGITITQNELDIMIEAAVHEMNSMMKGDGKNANSSNN